MSNSDCQSIMAAGIMPNVKLDVCFPVVTIGTVLNMNGLGLHRNVT